MLDNLPILAQVTRLHFSRAHSLLAEVGIHPGQYRLLKLLHTSQGLSQHEIARKLIIKPSTLTIMLKRLERDGLITKERDSNDKRIFRIYLSPKEKRPSLRGVKNLPYWKRSSTKDFQPLITKHLRSWQL